MNDYIEMILGMILAGVGGELFVRGTVGLARWARISPGIIGATVAAFSTSSPELTVSVSASLSGTPQIALGDALGSNVLNVAVILAIALSISGMRVPRDGIRRDFPVALLVPVVTGILLLDGILSRPDGLLMMGLFLAWLVRTILEARRQRSAAEEVLGERRGWLSIIVCLAGLILLVAAGKFIVSGATDIALSFGIHPFIIGATVVAVGTSVPELATTIISKLRGHDEVGLGTILGSNIFNGLFIVSVAAIISPITVDRRETLVALLFGLFSLLAVYPVGAGRLRRRRGGLLLILYGIYLVLIIRSNWP